MSDFALMAREHIDKHPLIRESLKRGLVNYSSLAREILDENGIVGKGFNAVKMACVRYAGEISEDTNNVRETLGQSKISVNNKRFVIHLDSDYYKTMDLLKDFEVELFQGKTLTLVGNMEDLEKIKDRIGMWRLAIEDCVEICFENNENIENTPGVLSYLYGLFGEHGINIYETWSCYTDTRIIIDKKDVEKMVGVLRW